MRPYEKAEDVPKVIHREQRRREIAEVVLALTVTEGVEAVSLRKVATRAGLAVGTVQHYFADREEMMTYAIALMEDQRAARVQSAIAALGSAPEERAVLRTLFLEVLPLTDRTRFETAVGAAYYIRALNHSPTAEVLRKRPPQVIGLLRGLLAAAQQRGVLADGVDVGLEAELLWSLFDGSGLMAGYRTEATAMTLIDYHLGRLFLDHYDIERGRTPA